MENTIPPSEIAEVILPAVTSDNPEFRYVGGKDATTLVEMRKSMSDVEFENMKKQFVSIHHSNSIIMSLAT